MGVGGTTESGRMGTWHMIGRSKEESSKLHQQVHDNMTKHFGQPHQNATTSYWHHPDHGVAIMERKPSEGYNFVVSHKNENRASFDRNMKEQGASLKD